MLYSTERLYVRLLKLSDLPEFTDLQTNPNVARYTMGKAQTPAECKADLEKVLNHYQANDGFRVWAVCLKASNELIGTVAIISTGDGNEIGYRFREKFWGNGYGLEATKGLIKYAFEKLNLPHLFAEVDERNPHSIAILDRTMKRVKSFWNEKDQTQDLLFELKNPNT
jgi:ribosomal-protein-alanine N-acetyltransferase